MLLNPQLAHDFLYIRKQSMQLASKMRFLAAQFDALLSDELWLRCAGHANAMAARLAGAVAGMSRGSRSPGRWRPTRCSPTLPPAVTASLQARVPVLHLG